MNSPDEARRVDAPESNSRFRLMRYFSIASLIGILLTLAILVFFYRNYAFQALEEHETRHNEAITKIFVNTIWHNYAAYVASASTFSRSELQAHPEVARIREDVLRQMVGLSIVKIKIYNLDGLTVFSTDPQQIGEDKSTNSGFLTAKRGGIASDITFRNHFDAFEQVINDRNLISSYVPIRTDSNARVEGVMEVYADVTDYITKLTRTTWQIFTVCMGSLSLLYLFLFVIVRRADLRISSQSNEVRESEIRLRSVIETAHDGIIIFDERGTITTINPAAEGIFSYAAAEMIGHNVKMLMPEPYRSNLHNNLDSGKGVVIDVDREVSGQRKDGSIFPMDVVVSEVNIRDEKMFTGIVRDITERKQQEAELIQAREEAELANKAKSQFLASMSHELRTPLNAILGYGQLLEIRDGNISPEEAQENIAEIMRAGAHLLALVNEVLDLSRIEFGRLEIQSQAVALKATVGECVYQIDVGLARQCNITLIDQTDDSEVMVMADPKRLRQVLSNLLSNAVKYNCEGGTVTVKTRPAGKGYLRIGVTDTGPGIPQSDMEKLFEPFERLKHKGSGIEGTGIGLTIAKQLVEAMGGTIGVEGADISSGSTFWFELPLAEKTPSSGHKVDL